ncbi:MAG: adenylosuccinate lyase [Candidatus Dadabacteria bacterium]|nr:adenylosuccinate lyase [Candidatus Dadabacteria bacterium]NIQ13598.1 adenylosuccinate lyase [Candidatus Dadabacteria bacterium]
MIPRYSRKIMSDIWSDENKYKTWLKIEVAVCEAWAHYGEIPKKSLKIIKEKADFDIERINELEKEIKHDVLAFLTSVSEFVGDDSRFIHLGMTSSDVLDTALAIQLRDAGKIILEDLSKLISVLKEKAFQCKDIPMIGRSHGIHAEPKTLGLVFALWFDEMKRNIKRMENAVESISVGMMSGAVGTYANIDPKVEEYACKLLDLKPASISTQVIHRDIHAEYFLTLSLIASSIERIATEIRHFQRTEVLEMEEPFSKGQKGSSAMPHKRNPILSENLCGLARVVRSNSIAALENISLWHERDISHSSVERIIGPDGTILIDFMLNRLINLLDGLQIYEENLSKNIWLTNGLVFSQKVLLKLVNKGVTREKAYSLVQRNAMTCWKEKSAFKDLLKNDSEISDILTPDEIDSCFDVKQDFKNIDHIFEKVFN